MIDEYAMRDNKHLIKLGAIALAVVVIVTIVVLIIVSVNKNNKCNNIYDNVKKQVLDYINNNNLKPKINGDYVEINLSDLPNKIYLNELACEGVVKYTKHNDEYVLTYNLNNCNYCSTNNANWSSYSNKYPKNKKNIDVVATYNYVTVAEYNTKWSNWIASDKVSNEETDGVKLPLDKNILPRVPEGGIISKIVKEDEIRYSYRDKRWKWYENNNASYSKLSSTAPKGYPNKDVQTEYKTKLTDWSMNYPKEESYRVITSSTGYRWYKLDGKEKTYWNNGAYYPTKPEEGYLKDNSSNVAMYRYYDRVWRWYKDVRRGYSSYSSAPYSSFIYKDSELIEYSSWSSFRNTSSLNASNKSYREEKQDTYSRYLIKYKIKSMEVLNNYLEKDELERQINMKLDDVANNNKYELIVKFKYRYY